MADDFGKLVLRVSLGVLILLHGLFKLQNGIDGIAGMLSSHGLPAFLAYGVYIGEVIAPALVILGVFTRIGALLIAGNMLVAFGLAHLQELFSLGQWVAGLLSFKACFCLDPSPSPLSVRAGSVLAGPLGDITDESISPFRPSSADADTLVTSSRQALKNVV